MDEVCGRERVPADYFLFRRKWPLEYMMPGPQANDHQENPQAQDQASNDASAPEGVIEDSKASPPAQPPTATRTKIKQQDNPFARSKIPGAIVYWLHHYWDAPREKSKRTDTIMVLLTFAIAVAAFWSACIFQRQLTVARDTMDAQTRPWVGNGKIEIKNTMFLVYPDNPMQARTQFDFEINVPLKNTGNSPALNVEMGVNGTMTKEIGAFATVQPMMESACGGANGNAAKVGTVLFPNSPETPFGWPINMMTPFIQIEEVHRVWIQACVVYNDTNPEKRLHRTKIWMVSWPINGKPKEVRRTSQPTVIYYSLPIDGWSVARTEAN